MAEYKSGFAGERWEINCIDKVLLQRERLRKHFFCALTRQPCALPRFRLDKQIWHSAITAAQIHYKTMKEETEKVIDVVAAVIIRENRVFATQRGYGQWKDWWEFPGGKVEAGETREQALCREIREELNTDIRVGQHLATVVTPTLRLHFYACEVISGSLELIEAEDAAWLAPKDLPALKWLPNDRHFIQHDLPRFLAEQGAKQDK